VSDRAVFDCMVYLQAASRPHRTHGCFDAVQRGELQLFVSADILAEIDDVLNRPEIRRHFPALTDEAVKAFLADILSFATLVADVRHVFTLTRDPKDEKYVDLALSVDARYLVTADNDLLDLMDQATPTGKEFHQRYPLLQIMKPGTLVWEMEQRREKES
jgi:putative PIN family toxin of toxin-antitoxin system